MFLESNKCVRSGDTVGRTGEKREQKKKDANNGNAARADAHDEPTTGDFHRQAKSCRVSAAVHRLQRRLLEHNVHLTVQRTTCNNRAMLVIIVYLNVHIKLSALL